MPPEPSPENDVRLSALSDAMRAFAEATSDPALLLETIARRAADATGDLCGLFLLSADRTTLVPEAPYCADETVLALTRELLVEPIRLASHPIARAVIEKREAILSPRVDLDLVKHNTTESHHRWLTRIGVHSMLMVPMRVHGEPLGMIIFSRFRPGAPPLGQSELKLAQGLADHAALAVANARLIANAQHELADKNRIAERLRFLTDAAQEFAAATGDSRQLLQAIARRLSEAVGDLCAIRPLSADGLFLESTGAVHHPDPKITEVAIELAATEPNRVGVGISGKVAATGEGIIQPHVDLKELTASDVGKRFEKLLRVMDVKSSMALPLLCRGKVVGVANLLRGGNSAPYNEEDLQLALSIADHAALAVANARLYEAERAARGAAERAQHELTRTETRYRVLFNNSPLPKALYDVESLRFIAVNAAALALYGYTREEFLQLRAIDVTAPDVMPLPEHQLSTMGTTKLGLRKHKRKNGQLLTVDVTAHLFRLGERLNRLLVLQDVTERLSLEQQLRQSQKMEAVGRLAGGVAHDFNNLLSVIMSYGEMAMEELAQGSPLHSDLEQIQKAARQAGALTRQLLMFSRQQVLEPKVLSLNELLDNMRPMLARILGEDIEVKTLLAPSLGSVRVDAGSIEQVVMNLVVNSRDAMPTGGKLTLETENVMLDDAFAREHLGAHAGPHVMLAVTDDGEGMDRQTQERMFEPFFTTKGQGKGTGLGLSTVFGIAQQSGGTIWVYSEPGRGTTFKIYFPRVDGAPEASRPLLPRTLRGTETILLVEDDDQVRTAARRILQGNGYVVLDARSADQALHHCATYKGRIDLLLTDVVMPQTSGPVLARRIERELPGVRVLFMSGYTDDSVVRHGVLQAEMAYLQKPITSESLSRKVREVLDAPRVSNPASLLRN